MRRKLTAALLTAAMAISLTACGGSGDTASAGASSRSSNTLVTAEPLGPSAVRVAVVASFGCSGDFCVTAAFQHKSCFILIFLHLLIHLKVPPFLLTVTCLCWIFPLKNESSTYFTTKAAFRQGSRFYLITL